MLCVARARAIRAKAAHAFLYSSEAHSRMGCSLSEHGASPGGSASFASALTAAQSEGRRGQGAEDGASRRTPQRGDDPKAVGVHSEGVS